MKKMISKSLILGFLAAKFLCYENASADFQGPQVSKMNQSNQDLTTVQDVLNESNSKTYGQKSYGSRIHGKTVFLKGNIMQQLSHDKFTFKDNTGEITIDIDAKHMPFDNFSSTDTVIISGKVERKNKGLGIEIDVDRVEIVKEGMKK